MTFAPRFSPDGRHVIFSMASGGNTDIYRVSVSGGGMTRLTTSPGIDTGARYSPDGSKIVLDSERGGSQHLFDTNEDGSGQQRNSVGEGRHGTPACYRSGDMTAYFGSALSGAGRGQEE